jgi:hypothetical protein
MSDQGRRRLAWVVWAVTVLVYVAEVALLFANADLPAVDPIDEVDPWLQAMEDLAFVAVGTLGLRLVLAQPRNAFCWWVVVSGLSFPFEGFAVEFTRFGIDRWGAIPVVAAISWVSLWAWIPGSFSIPFLLLLYPDGHVPSARWRPALWFTVTVVVVTFLAAALLVEPETVAGVLPNPLGISALSDVINTVFVYAVVPGQLIAILLGVMSLVARYRKGEGVQRHQVKVLLWVAPVAVVFFAVVARIDSGPIWLGSVLNFVFTLLIGSAVTLAVLRYRLFEIDRLISRTVTYTVVAGALGLVYGFGAVWLPSRVVGEQTPLFVAGSTLAVVALFNPLRRRVMKWVDRRFNRSSYDAERIADTFAARLRDPVDPDQLAADWAAVVRGALEPTVIGVWFR